MGKFYFGKSSLEKLKEVHPELVKVVEYALENSPVDFTVMEGVRSLEQQKKNFEKGVSKTLNSYHLRQDDGLGHAVDLVPWVNGKAKWEWEPIYHIAEAMRAGAKFHGVRVRWGGFWGILNDTKKPVKDIVYSYRESQLSKGLRAFLDGPHFEYRGLAK